MSKVSSDAQAFDAIVADLESPAYVVTTAAGAERDGCLVGFASQCSIDPPRFVVWLSKAIHGPLVPPASVENTSSEPPSAVIRPALLQPQPPSGCRYA